MVSKPVIKNLSGPQLNKEARKAADSERKASEEAMEYDKAKGLVKPSDREEKLDWARGPG